MNLIRVMPAKENAQHNIVCAHSISGKYPKWSFFIQHISVPFS